MPDGTRTRDTGTADPSAAFVPIPKELVKRHWLLVTTHHEIVAFV